MAKKTFYAICFFQDKTKQPLKYRNVYDDFSFEKFAQSKNLHYINFYNKDRSYSHRKYLQSNQTWMEYLSK